MKRSQKYGVLSMLCIAAALMLGLTWFIVCTVIGVGLLMNGPWLMTILVALLGMVFGFASYAAEINEHDEERGQIVERQQSDR